MSQHNKIIGNIGGMGPEAGVMLHQYVNFAARKILKTKKDADYPDVIHLALPDGISDRTDYLLGLTDENPADAVISIAEILSQIGRKRNLPILATIACVTFHTRPLWEKFISGISKLDNISFVSLLDST